MINTKSIAGKIKKIVLIGARMDGHAGVVVDILREIGGYELVGFIDNTPEFKGKRVNGVSVLGSTEELETIPIPADCVHISIGDNVARAKLFGILKARGLTVETLVHPTAVVSQNVQVGEGCFIGPLSVINNSSVIGDVAIINSGAIVEHNNKIGLAVHMASGTRTAGRVQVDDFTFVGIGASILPNIHIGSGAMVGAGATVVRDVSSKETIIGYAGKKFKKNIYVDTEPDISSPTKIYVAQPSLPDYPLLDEKFKDISKSLILSNFAKYSNRLEIDIETRLRVKKALTFPNGTTALMLAIKALGLKGEIILPSFTFSATGHAVVWNGLTPVFADIDPDTFNIDPADVEGKITNKTTAILGVHIFGNPAEIKRLEAIAEQHELKLVFDSAHALGSEYHNKSIGGFGDVECFSLSGTKVITSAEGGIATSNNNDLMKKMHLGRNYGAGADYDCQYIGLNGKMSEFHAAIALETFALIDKFMIKRNKLTKLYKERLSEIPGISFQYIPEGHLSTFKDFAILIDREQFGLDRDELARELNQQGIFPKKYFLPIHRMKSYKEVEHRAENLVHTESVADNILCLPIYSHMNDDKLEKICYTVFRIWRAANKR